MLQRMSYEACDVLQAVPKAESDKDIYLLSAVLHGFDDDTCRHRAAQRGECRRRHRRHHRRDGDGHAGCQADAATASFDMQMFVNSRGRERTLGEWQRLFEKSGVVLQEVVGLQSFGKILVLRAG